MTLERYRRERIVVQRPDTPVAEAACAMESNHIGVVLVQERGRPIGLLTDRDIALRVVGRGLDPVTTQIRHVMTPDPAMLPIDAAEQEAIVLMRDRHVRRIPLVEGERIAGIVTLDDLILDDGADPRSVAGLVRAQLEEPAEHKPAGETHPTRPPQEPEMDDVRSMRHAAHAEQTLYRAVQIVQEETGLMGFDRAVTALLVVVSGIVRRITPPEAGDFLSQLPAGLRERVLASVAAAGPDREVTRESIDVEMQQRLGVDRNEASELVWRVGAALARLVSPGEIHDVSGQLPEKMRAIFETPSPRLH
jgi:CBS domain-containing protein/uncharacterized protein (DUF2267 family)